MNQPLFATFFFSYSQKNVGIFHADKILTIILTLTVLFKIFANSKSQICLTELHT